MLLAGVDHIPAALMVLRPANLDRLARAIRWPAILLGDVHLPEAPAPLRRPGAAVVLHGVSVIAGIEREFPMLDGMPNWKYLVVKRTTRDEWSPSPEGADLGLVFTDRLDEMLRKCGEKGWELVQMSLGDETFVFKQSN